VEYLASFETQKEAAKYVTDLVQSILGPGAYQLAVYKTNEKNQLVLRAKVYGEDRYDSVIHKAWFGLFRK